MVTAFKKCAFGLVALLFLSVAKAEDYTFFPIGPFGGLNNTDNSLIIPNDKAQDLLNVDITPGGKSVKKRKGYGLAFTLTNSTSAVHGIYTFYDSNGNTVDLYANDTYLSGSISGNNPTVIFSTGPNGATYQCVDSQGYAYCVNTSRTPITQTDGDTYSDIAPTENGTLIAVTPDRLVLSGFSSAPNRIDFSASANFSNWTVGGDPTSPTQETITAPGSKITLIAYAFNRLLWFKDSSFGYILFGPTLDDWDIKTVSPDVGTLENTYVYREGIFYFKGQDGHIYAYDGANLVKLTRDLEGIISLAQSKRSGIITQTNISDFGAGAYDSNIYVDTETVSGNIQTAFPDSFSTFRDGSGSTKNVWDTYDSGGTPPTCTYGISSGKMQITNSGSSLGRCSIFTATIMRDFRQGTTYHFEISSITLSDSLYLTIVSTRATSPANPDNLGLVYEFTSTTTGRAYMSQYSFDGFPVVGLTSDYALPLTVDLFLSTTSFQLTLNGVIALTASHGSTLGDKYIYFSYGKISAGSGITTFDNFGVAPQTFTYTSQLLNIGTGITAWDSFGVANTLNDGTISYQFGSTNTASVSAITNYQSITNGAIPTISTGAYGAVKAAFSTDEWDDLPQLNDFSVRWFEGLAEDKSYAIYFKDAIWWSITYGTGTTTNNRVLRYDLINSLWTVYDIPSNGFLVRGNNLYFGSTLVGEIYQFGNSEDDNGEDIEAYWKSKDFFVDTPFNEKDFTNLSIAAASVISSSITVTYTVNGSSSVSYTVPLYSPSSSFSKKNVNLPLGTNGVTFNVEFGNDASDQPFEVYGLQYGVRPKSWKPTP